MYRFLTTSLLFFGMLLPQADAADGRFFHNVNNSVGTNCCQQGTTSFPVMGEVIIPEEIVIENSNFPIVDEAVTNPTGFVGTSMQADEGQVAVPAMEQQVVEQPAAKVTVETRKESKTQTNGLQLEQVSATRVDSYQWEETPKVIVDGEPREYATLNVSPFASAMVPWVSENDMWTAPDWQNNLDSHREEIQQVAVTKSAVSESLVESQEMEAVCELGTCAELNQQLVQSKSNLTTKAASRNVVSEQIAVEPHSTTVANSDSAPLVLTPSKSKPVVSHKRTAVTKRAKQVAETGAAAVAGRPHRVAKTQAKAAGWGSWKWALLPLALLPFGWFVLANPPSNVIPVGGVEEDDTMLIQSTTGKTVAKVAATTAAAGSTVAGVSTLAAKKTGKTTGSKTVAKAAATTAAAGGTVAGTRTLAADKHQATTVKTTGRTVAKVAATTAATVAGVSALAAKKSQAIADSAVKKTADTDGTGPGRRTARSAQIQCCGEEKSCGNEAGFGKTDFNKTDFNKTEFNKSDFKKGEFKKGEFSNADFNTNELGKGEMDKVEFCQEDAGDFESGVLTNGVWRDGGQSGREGSQQEGAQGVFGFEETQSDDLTLIEGICPETQDLLNEAGICSFADVANADKSKLMSAVMHGGSRFSSMNMSRWSEEADAFRTVEWTEFDTEEWEEVATDDSNGRDDLTSIYGVDFEMQQSLYSAGIFRFADLAVVDRAELKRTMVERDSRFASFDFDRCCDQAKSFAPTKSVATVWQDGLWQEVAQNPRTGKQNQHTTRQTEFEWDGSEELDFSVDDEEVDMLFELTETQNEVNEFKNQRSGKYKSQSMKSGGGDDLTKIHGIGPATQRMLAQVGITSFTDLASTDLNRLERLVKKSGTRFQISDPKSWLAQAALAVNGQWDELEALKSQKS